MKPSSYQGALDTDRPIQYVRYITKAAVIIRYRVELPREQLLPPNCCGEWPAGTPGFGGVERTSVIINKFPVTNGYTAGAYRVRVCVWYDGQISE
jgi:hypothetical protein